MRSIVFVKLKSSAVFMPVAFLFCGCVGGLDRNARYEVGAVYETVVPIVIEPDERFSYVFASHDSHLTQNLIDLRKNTVLGMRWFSLGLGLKLMACHWLCWIPLGVCMIRLMQNCSTVNMLDLVFFLENISRSEDPLFGVMRWYPDFSIIKRIE
jgi:hypothetical protein